MSESISDIRNTSAAILARMDTLRTCVERMDRQPDLRQESDKIASSKETYGSELGGALDCKSVFCFDPRPLIAGLLFAFVVWWSDGDKCTDKTSDDALM